MGFLAATTDPNALDNAGAILVLIVLLGVLIAVISFAVHKIPGGPKMGPEPKSIISKIIGKGN